MVPIFFGRKYTLFLLEKRQFETHNQSLTLALTDREILLDGGINLHLFDWEQVPFAGGPVYGVTHQCLDNSLSWDAKSVPSDSTVAASSGPRAAVDRSGLFALGWEPSCIGEDGSGHNQQSQCQSAAHQRRCVKRNIFPSGVVCLFHRSR